MSEVYKYVPGPKWWIVGLSALLIAACASGPRSGAQKGQSKNAWTVKALSAALANPSRPRADKDRDADRKSAQLVAFFGVERGMTVMDLVAATGYMTEVLSVAVGTTGKVYAENPSAWVDGVGKALSERLANNRLPNVVRLDGDYAAPPPSSVDVVITIMNLHDIYNSVRPMVPLVLKYVYDALKPGGLFCVVDHVGKPGVDNTSLHRMTKQQAIDVVKAAGFVMEADSNVLEHPSDDHTKIVTDPSVRGKTDQFTLKFGKPK